MHGNRDQTRARRDYKTRDGTEHSFGVLGSVYSHARRAFDPSAYARNQKATSLTRVSVTHQPLEIPAGLAGCLPACRSVGSTCPERRRGEPDREESEERESLSRGSVSHSRRMGNSKNSGPAEYTCIPSSTAYEWQTLNEKKRNPFYPSGTNRGLFPRITYRRGAARTHLRGEEREREQVSRRRIRIIKCPLLSEPSPVHVSTFHFYPRLSLSLFPPLPAEPLNR